jgi:hypothetical protein
MHTCKLLTSCVAIAASVHAQNEVYVPPVYQMLDAPGLGRCAGFTQRLRQQILISSAYLNSARGQTLTSLTLRRDGSFRGALAAGAVDLVLSLSETTVAPDAAQPGLAGNRTALPTTVVQGRVNLPASPAIGSANEPTWVAPYAVTIPFAEGFTYRNGHLCMDIDGVPVAGNAAPWWPIDYALDGSTGSVVNIGSGCGRFNRASASRSQLVLGGSLRLLASGEPGSVAVPVIGFDAALNLDMSFLGATGCTLRVNPVLSFVDTYRTAADPRKPGIAELDLQLPHSPTLLGSRFAVQWLDFQRMLPPPRWSNAAGITFSNALELTLSARSQTILGTTIEVGVYPTGALPDTGHVTPCRMPVMRWGF